MTDFLTMLGFTVGYIAGSIGCCVGISKTPILSGNVSLYTHAAIYGISYTVVAMFVYALILRACGLI